MCARVVCPQKQITNEVLTHKTKHYATKIFTHFNAYADRIQYG